MNLLRLQEYYWSSSIILALSRMSKMIPIVVLVSFSSPTSVQTLATILFAGSTSWQTRYLDDSESGLPSLLKWKGVLGRHELVQNLECLRGIRRLAVNASITFPNSATTIFCISLCLLLSSFELTLGAEPIPNPQDRRRHLGWPHFGACFEGRAGLARGNPFDGVAGLKQVRIPSVAMP